MKIKAQLLEDIENGGVGEVVTVLGFISDNDYTYAIVAFQDKPLFEVEISKLLYLA